MSSFQPIDEGDFIAIQESFIENISGLDDLENIFPLTFSNSWGVCYGYKITKADFIELMNSAPAVAKWKIKFGYTNTEETAALRLTLSGVDANGQQATPHPNYVLTKPMHVAHHLGCNVDNGIIGSDIACKWLDNFIDQASDETIAKSIFTLPSNQLLRGYTFEADDFLQPQQELPEFADFYIAFAIHNALPLDAPYNLGLLLAAGSPLEGYSHFYDMGSTCPPHC